MVLAYDRQRTLITKYLPGDSCVDTREIVELGRNKQAKDELEATQCITNTADNIHSPVWSGNSPTAKLEVELK